VRTRPLYRWSLVLSLLALFGALAAVPLANTYALAMTATAQVGTPSNETRQASSGTTAALPCHKPGQPCPNCPQKVCPDMSTCLVKCFQTLAPLVAEARLYVTMRGLRMPQAPQQASHDTSIPPLLRPPSV
jgi:hypothetical protein